MSTGTLSNSFVVIPPDPADSNTGFFSTNIRSNGPGFGYNYITPSPFRMGVFSGSFDNSLSISWDLHSPENDNLVTTDYEMKGLDSFSGFSINVYMTTGDFSGYSSNYGGYVSADQKVLLTGVKSQTFVSGYLLSDLQNTGLSPFTVNPLNFTPLGLSYSYAIPEMYRGTFYTGEISGSERRFSIDVISTDIYSGTQTGSIRLANSRPEVSVAGLTGSPSSGQSQSGPVSSGSRPYYENTGIVSGEFTITYNIRNGKETIDFQPYTEIYLLSGLSSGTSGNFDYTGNQLSEYQVYKTTGNTKSGKFVIKPYLKQYVALKAYDNYGPSSLVGLYYPQTGQVETLTSYTTGTGGALTTLYNTGYSFETGLGDPAVIYREVALGSKTTGIRASGGDAIFYDVYGDYNPTGSGIETRYRVKGINSSAYSGVHAFNAPIYAGSGILTSQAPERIPGNGSYNSSYSSDSMVSFYQENSTIYHSRWAPGESYWAAGEPKHDNWLLQNPLPSGFDEMGDLLAASGHTYAIFDASKKKATSLTHSEVLAFTRRATTPLQTGTLNDGTTGIRVVPLVGADENGFPYSCIGCFSQPIGEPNSMNIKFRSGLGFAKSTYEEAASHLRDKGEMMAVFMYREQVDRASQIASGWTGYIGLRRGKTNIFSPSPNIASPYAPSGTGWDGYVRSEDWEEFPNNFKEMKFGNVTGTGIQYFQPPPYAKTGKIINNYVRTGWAWIGSSGESIYKIAGSGFEKIRTFVADFETTYNNEIVSSLYGVTGEIPRLEFEDESIEFNDQSAEFSFKVNPDFYEDGNGLDFQSGFISYQVYTGQIVGDVPISDHYLAETKTPGFNKQSNINYTPIGSGNPPRIRFLLYDGVGSGIPSDSYSTSFSKQDQAGVVGLDDEYYGQLNWKTVPLAFGVAGTPTVTYSLYFTGNYHNCPNVQFLGAMLSGFNSEGATFIFSNDVPATGYALAYTISKETSTTT